MTKLKQVEHLNVSQRSLQIAEQAATEMVGPHLSAAALERKWREFLTCWHSALSFAIKAAEPGRTKRIADGIRNDRKKDPILQYLWQARDAEEHTGRAVDRVSGELILISNAGSTIKSVKCQLPEDGPGSKVWIENCSEVLPNGVEIPVPFVAGQLSPTEFKGVVDNGSFAVAPPGIRLLAAKTRSGEYAVPKIEANEFDRPTIISRYAIDYARQQITKLRELFQD